MYLNFAEGVHIGDLSGHARTGVILSPSASPSEWHKRISEITRLFSSREENI